MDGLREAWPVPDLRDDALFRLLRRVIAASDGASAELSDEERAYLVAASHGLTYSETGEVLGRSDETVQSELKHARRKLAAKNTTHAVAIALRRGLIQ